MSTVNWYLESEDTPRSIFFPPKRLVALDKAANRDSPLNACPAISDLKKDLFVILSPWDLTLKVELTSKGAELHLDEKTSSLSPSIAKNYISLMSRRDWRDPGRPIIQIFVPYTFVPDDDLVVVQTPPFQHWFGARRPGLVIGGKFRAQQWPRPLAFAFEWFDVSSPLRVSRGEALFYVSFDRHGALPVSLQEIEKSKEIAEQQNRIGGVAAHIRSTGKLIHEETERAKGDGRNE